MFTQISKDWVALLPNSKINNNDEIYKNLPAVNFVSFLAIGLIEFAIPYVGVSYLDAGPLFISCAAIGRYLPQVIFSSWSAKVVAQRGYRDVCIGSELLRIIAFCVCIIALFFPPLVAATLYIFATVLVSMASILTNVAINVVVPLIAEKDRRIRLFSHLSVTESSADAGAPFLAGVLLALWSPGYLYGISVAAAAAALLLFRSLPDVRSDIPIPVAVGGEQRSYNLRYGIALNFSKGPLQRLSIWSIIYNCGQSVIMAVFLVVLFQRTGISSFEYGVMSASAVGFAILGAYLPVILSRIGLRRISFLQLFGALTLLAYFMQGWGLGFLYGTACICIVWISMMLDELFSAGSAVFIATIRAEIISDEERPIATAANRTVGMMSVVAGYSIGALAALVVSPSSVIFVCGILMALGSVVLWGSSSGLREAEVTCTVRS